MTPKHIAGITDRGAVFLSRMMKEKKIPDSEREAAADLAIDLALVSKNQLALADKGPAIPPLPTTPGTHSI